jgi:hypothetical protein
MSVTSLEIYGAVTITGNQVTIKPQSTSSIVLTANSTMPHVGDVVSLTAQLPNPTSGITVFYYYNGTYGNSQLGSASTSNTGKAILNFTVSSLDVMVIYPQATIP